MLPSQVLVDKGLSDLECDVLSVEALLVLDSSPRLRWLGVKVPEPGNAPKHPELALYTAIRESSPDDTHSRYNTLIRRLVSYGHELERQKFSSRKR